MGVPGVGDRVFHPHHGHGTVTGHEGDHAVVKFDTAGEHRFEVTPGGKPATLQPRAENPQAATTVLAVKGAADVGRLLGGGATAFNGTVDVLPEKGNEAVLARMGWNGTMHVREDLMGRIADAQNGGPIKDPDAFAVIQHELIHSVTSGGAGYGSQADTQAYQRRTPMMIEEGFTELGSTQHAAEFFDTVGVGDRPTPVLAIKDGHPVEDAQGKLAKATMSEYATRLADPKRIANGKSWGHYRTFVAAAQKWSQQVASLEGLRGQAAAARTVQLTDEMNRASVADKPAVLAKQVMRAAGVPDQETDGGQLSAITEMTIYTNWGAADEHAGESVDEAVKAIAPWMPSRVQYT